MGLVKSIFNQSEPFTRELRDCIKDLEEIAYKEYYQRTRTSFLAKCGGISIFILILRIDIELMSLC